MGINSHQDAQVVPSWLRSSTRTLGSARQAGFDVQRSDIGEGTALMPNRSYSSDGRPNLRRTVLLGSSIIVRLDLLTKA